MAVDVVPRHHEGSSKNLNERPSSFNPRMLLTALYHPLGPLGLRPRQALANRPGPVVEYRRPAHTYRTDAAEEVPMSLHVITFSRSPRRALLVAKRVGVVIVLLGLGLTAASWVAAETATVDCNTGGIVGPTLARLKPGDVLLVQGTCQENILIQAGLNHITLDGQGKASIHAPDTRQPAVQVLGREVTIKGLIVTGGEFGIAINRGATAIVEGNTMEHAALSGLEVSQNSFARVIKNSIRQNQSHGILVLG